MSDAVRLPRALVNQLLHCAQSSPDLEVCGLIGAQAGTPATWYPVANVADHPDRRFRLDPAGQIEALRAMRETGEELFAILHSHPTSPAEPSQIDLAEIGYPETCYLIISLNTKGVLEMRGFRLGQDRHFGEVDLVLVETFP
ncbi:MAG: M67 family metallopeptidase [Methylococcaceae bacterium]|nr:M67 family metallopeptidase [Methylococcaceae bacterium]